jgi:hypothetical protein
VSNLPGETPRPLPGTPADSGPETLFEKVRKKLEWVWQRLLRESRRTPEEEERPEGPPDAPTSRGDESRNEAPPQPGEPAASAAGYEVSPAAGPDDVWGSLEPGWTWSDRLPHLGEPAASAAGSTGAAAEEGAAPAGADGGADGGGEE